MGAKLLSVADLNLVLRYPNPTRGQWFPRGSLAYLFVRMRSKVTAEKNERKTK